MCLAVPVFSLHQLNLHLTCWCLHIRTRSIPNVTILEYGSIEPRNIHAIKSEIYARCVTCCYWRSIDRYYNKLTITLLAINRGPIKTSINANYLRNYTGGILGSDDDPALLDANHNHGVSIVGWGYDEERDSQHWIIRNSWGVYWVSRHVTGSCMCLIANTS